jgi:EAL domain-containing protein (putative c-di-GMP-specific phosphodiesterase class I)
LAPALARAHARPGDAAAGEADLLSLEPYENVLVVDEDRALAVLTALKRVGVKLALDDFGSGQSSLNHIKWFPIDVVKIDREFITDIVENHASSLIVDAVVGLSHGLGLKVVAEGVETRAQLKRVADLGCDYSQGYLFARPEPADEMDILLTSHHILPWSRPMQLSLGPNKEAAAGPSSARGGESPLLPALENWRRKQA